MTSNITFRNILALAAALLLMTVALPASAINGRDAVGMCIDSTANGSRCAWSVNGDGEIDICNANGCVHCESATAECTMARTAPPKRPFPVGTQIHTPLGVFKVSNRTNARGIDTLIKPVKRAP